jgi:hypothetical protein
MVSLSFYCFPTKCYSPFYFFECFQVCFSVFLSKKLNRWYLKSLSEMSKDDNSNICLIEFKVLFKDLSSFLSSIKADLNREFLDPLSNSIVIFKHQYLYKWYKTGWKCTQFSIDSKIGSFTMNSKNIFKNHVLYLFKW